MIDWIKDAQRCVVAGGRDLYDGLPTAACAIIEHELWRNYTTRKGETFSSFPDFVQVVLDLDWDQLREYCRIGDKYRRSHNLTPCHFEQTLNQAAPELAQPGGDGSNQYSKKENSKVDNVNIAKGGNNPTYILRRLKRDRPDLAERVIANKLSAHAAAVEAGFRKRYVQVGPTVDGFAGSIGKHLESKQIKKLIAQLGANHEPT